jgi:glycosyltransferase involved in cell wall biosynthesis
MIPFVKRIYFTVTNDLSYDQRMNRICTTLAENGYDITLVGFRLKRSLPLRKEPYRQKRIRCWFKKGKSFYAEYNIRLFLYLLSRKMDAICAIDLDTILPCLKISSLKKIPRIYDAHELFTELKEVVTRPTIHRKWLRIEKYAVPKFRHGYTVSEGIAEEFKRRYGVSYTTIRNLPRLRSYSPPEAEEKFILYQGAVNEARAFEFLVPAMKEIPLKLVICGDGNFMPQLRSLIHEHGLAGRIELKGMLPPAELWKISQQAYMGVAIAENQGMNQWLALPNKFFDYIHAGLPQVTMDFPEYRKINKEFEVAVLIESPAPALIAGAINKLLNDIVLYRRLRENCIKARNVLNWQHEEKKLLDIYKAILNT